MDEQNVLNTLDLVLEILQDLEYKIQASGVIAAKRVECQRPWALRNYYLTWSRL